MMECDTYRHSHIPFSGFRAEIGIPLHKKKMQDC